MRTLLDLLRENEASVQRQKGLFRSLLQDASVYLKILDPESGEKELIKSVAAELAKLVRQIFRLNRDPTATSA